MLRCLEVGGAVVGVWGGGGGRGGGEKRVEWVAGLGWDLGCGVTLWQRFLGRALDLHRI